MMLLLGCGGEKTGVVCCLLLVWNGKWVVSLLERDVTIGVWRGNNWSSVLFIVSEVWKVGSEVTGA